MPIKETGKLKLKGKVENYLNELIEKMRHEMRAQLGAAIDDYDVTGKGGKDRPELAATTSRSSRSSSRSSSGRCKTDEALDEIQKGRRRGAQGLLPSSSSRCSPT